MKPNQMVPYKIRAPKAGGSESLLSTWLGLPSVAIGLYVLVLLVTSDLWNSGVGRRLVEPENSSRLLYGPSGAIVGRALTTNYVLSLDGWLLIAVGAALGFAGSARRRGVSRYSLAGLVVNLLAFLVSWMISCGVLELPHHRLPPPPSNPQVLDTTRTAGLVAAGTRHTPR